MINRSTLRLPRDWLRTRSPWTAYRYQVGYYLLTKSSTDPIEQMQVLRVTGQMFGTGLIFLNILVDGLTGRESTGSE